MNTPLVSTVIVSYNSLADLADCLESLLNQSVLQEIIVVDNSSIDGTPEWVQSMYPDVKLVQTGRNEGYAGANNLGVDHALGDYVFILNPDTVLYPGVLALLLQAAIDHPNHIITPKLLQPDGTVNACGTQMHITGITTCYGVGDAPENYAGTFPVFLVSGAAFLLHRAMWEDIGGFESDYFMYMEDIDFGLRARLLGYETLCCADACVLHKWELNLSPRKFYWLERNRLMTLFRIYETRTFYRLAVSILFTELATWAYAVMKGWPYMVARVTSYGSLWRMRDSVKISRSVIQKKRKVSDRTLMMMMSSSLPFNQVLPPRMATLLLRATTPLFRAFDAGGERL